MVCDSVRYRRLVSSFYTYGMGVPIEQCTNSATPISYSRCNIISWPAVSKSPICLPCCENIMPNFSVNDLEGSLIICRNISRRNPHSIKTDWIQLWYGDRQPMLKCLLKHIPSENMNIMKWIEFYVCKNVYGRVNFQQISTKCLLKK